MKIQTKTVKDFSTIFMGWGDYFFSLTFQAEVKVSLLTGFSPFITAHNVRHIFSGLILKINYISIKP